MANNRELSQFGSFVEVADSTKLGIGASVGIGTTLPTVQLEVHGDVKTVSGKVGVQTAPTHDLQVYGQTQLDNLNVLGIGTFVNGIECSGTTLNVTAGFVANTARVSDLTDNRVVIAGGSGELEDDARFTFDGSDLTVGLSSGATISKDGDLTLTGVSTTSSAGPSLKLFRNSASPADADYIGEIKFNGENDNDEEVEYVKISGKILDASDGTEDGILEFEHLKAGSEVVTARFRSDSVQLVNGTNLNVNGDLDVDGETSLDQVTVSLASTFTGAIDANGGLDVTNGFVANSAKVSDLTDNNVVVAGISGELEGDTNFTYDTMKVGIGTDLLVTGVATFQSSVQAASFLTGASGSAIGFNTNTITGPAQMFIDPAAIGDNTGSLRIKGDLFVDGTTTQINSTTLEIADFIVGIATTATSDTLADGAGIQIGPSGNTFLYDNGNEAFTSSENLNVASAHTYKIAGTDVLSATTLGSAVVSSSLTSVGTLSGLTVSDNIVPSADSDHDIGTNTVRFANGYFDTVYGDGSNLTGIAADKIFEGNTNAEVVDTGSDGHFKVTTEGTERLRITSAGSVGIGTDNPSSTFVVRGDDLTKAIRFQTNTSTQSSMLFQNSTTGYSSNDGLYFGIDQEEDGYLWHFENENLIFGTNNTERLRIDSAGLVGIGTATPADTNSFTRALDVSGPSGSAVYLRTAGGGTAFGLLGHYGTTLHLRNESAGDLRLSTNATERLRITSDGNIGIGTDTFTATSSGRQIVEIEGASGSLLNFAVGGARKAYHFTDGTDVYSYNTANGNYILGTNNTEKLRIKSNGNIGINTTDPTGKVQIDTTSGGRALTVNAPTLGTYLTFETDGTAFADIGSLSGLIGSGSDTDTLALNARGSRDLAFRTGSTERLRITSDGDVNVGNISNLVASGAGKLNILADNTTNIGIATDGAINIACVSGAGGSRTQSINWVPGFNVTLPTASIGHVFTDGSGYGKGDLFFATRGDTTNTAATERLRISSAGNVGINSSSPAVKLDIRSTDAIRVPVGTTGERPTGAAGYIRYNSSIASYEGHNGSEWAGIGGAAEVETAVSSTNATSCETFAKASYRSASIIAQITQGSDYQVGNYLVIHDGTTATVIEESAVATGDMLGTFTVAVLGSDVAFLVNMASSAAATVTTKMTKVSIPS